LNLSNIHIPNDVKYLLQLGEGFGLPINRSNFERTFIEFIKSIESNIINRPNNIVNVIRNNSVPILEKFHNDFIKSDSNSKLLFNWIKSTDKFVKEHPEVLFSKADKGNVTVALNKVDYINKMENMLSDNNTYEVINKDPTRKIISDLRNIFTILFMLELEQCVEHVYCELCQYTNGVSEKFKYFVTYLRQNSINNKYDVISILRKIYDKNSYIE
ncbi:hypothetical protein ALC57_15398, partial [Trachymyrmex cornetzi]